MRLPTAHRFQCDQCGTVAEWGPTWSWFGSIALAEEAPHHVIHTCSARCTAAMQANLKAGNVVQPAARPRGFYCRVIGERKGY